jgi:hypothetical protein
VNSHLSAVGLAFEARIAFDSLRNFLNCCSGEVQGVAVMIAVVSVVVSVVVVVVVVSFVVPGTLCFVSLFDSETCDVSIYIAGVIPQNSLGVAVVMIVPVVIAFV